jgi:hypothetical protein
MRAVAAAVTLGFCAVVLAALVPTPDDPVRAAKAPLIVPHELLYEYVVSCLDESATETCRSTSDPGDRTEGYNYVDAYERAQLYDYYSAVTVPCLASKGVELEPLHRSDFFVPDSRPWNPYTSMRDRPFDELVALYHACPPIPEYLLARHRS